MNRFAIPIKSGILICLVLTKSSTAAGDNDDLRTAIIQLKSVDATLRLRSVKYLSIANGNVQDAIPIIVDMVANDTDLSIRRSAARTLGRIGADSNHAVNALVDACGSADQETVTAAIAGLGRLGCQNNKAKKALILLAEGTSNQHPIVDALVRIEKASKSAEDVTVTLDKMEASNIKVKEWRKSAELNVELEDLITKNRPRK